MQERTCPECGEKSYSADTVTTQRCPKCGALVPAGEGCQWCEIGAGVLD